MSSNVNRAGLIGGMAPTQRAVDVKDDAFELWQSRVDFGRGIQRREAPGLDWVCLFQIHGCEGPMMELAQDF
jgi:hypothetical protein